MDLTQQIAKAIELRDTTDSLAMARAALAAIQAAGYAVVPVRATDAMLEELARIGDGPMISGEECWGYMLAAGMASACAP